MTSTGNAGCLKKIFAQWYSKYYCVANVTKTLTYYVAYVFNYIVLDINIILPRPTRLIILITMEGH
jgi:hypothetical protein